MKIVVEDTVQGRILRFPVEEQETVADVLGRVRERHEGLRTLEDAELAFLYEDDILDGGKALLSQIKTVEGHSPRLELCMIELTDESGEFSAAEVPDGALSIRRATPADIETIADFNCAIAAETEDRELERPDVVAGVTRLLEEPTRGFYLIAERGGAVVGQLMVTYEWSDWRDGNFWWIQSVYVTPDARRSGVYRALHDQLMADAMDQDDVAGLRLYVDRDNTGAHEAYRAVGLVETRYALFETDFVLGEHE